MRALRLCNPPALQLCLAASWPAISKRSHLGFRFLIDEYPDRTEYGLFFLFLWCKYRDIIPIVQIFSRQINCGKGKTHDAQGKTRRVIGCITHSQHAYNRLTINTLLNVTFYIARDGLSDGERIPFISADKGRVTSRRADKQTSRQADEQTSDKQTSRQADKQTSDKEAADEQTSDEQTSRRADE